MKIKVKKYEGPWPKEARFLEPGEEVLLATGAIGAGSVTTAAGYFIQSRKKLARSKA